MMANPIGLDGIEFIEFAAVRSDDLAHVFKDVSYQKLLEQFYPQADYVILPRAEANEYLKHLNFVCALVCNRLGRMSRKS